MEKNYLLNFHKALHAEFALGNREANKLFGTFPCSQIAMSKNFYIDQHIDGSTCERIIFINPTQNDLFVDNALKCNWTLSLPNSCVLLKLPDKCKDPPILVIVGQNVLHGTLRTVT